MSRVSPLCRDCGKHAKNSLQEHCFASATPRGLLSGWASGRSQRDTWDLSAFPGLYSSSGLRGDGGIPSLKAQLLAESDHVSSRTSMKHLLQQPTGLLLPRTPGQEPAHYRLDPWQGTTDRRALDVPRHLLCELS